MQLDRHHVAVYLRNIRPSSDRRKTYITAASPRAAHSQRSFGFGGLSSHPFHDLNYIHLIHQFQGPIRTVNLTQPVAQAWRDQGTHYHYIFLHYFNYLRSTDNVR